VIRRRSIVFWILDVRCHVGQHFICNKMGGCFGKKKSKDIYTAATSPSEDESGIELEEREGKKKNNYANIIKTLIVGEFGNSLSLNPFLIIQSRCGKNFASCAFCGSFL